MIQNSTGIKLHNLKGIDNFKEKIGKDVSMFMTFSREKAEKAQTREFTTIQPKESLSTLSKAKIIITNYLGGLYFLTVDEIQLFENEVNLIEGKHSKHSLLPSKGDIKDGLLKMILYSNLSQITVNGISKNSKAVLCLTSSKLLGAINSLNKHEEIVSFFTVNSFSESQQQLVETIFAEANSNQFIVKIQFSK